MTHPDLAPSRRQMLRRFASGFGMVGLAGLLAEDVLAAALPGSGGALSATPLRGPNPLAVVRLVSRVGDRLVVVAFLAGVAALAHGRVLLAGLEELHDRPGLGWTLLGGCWLSGLFGTTFLLRLMGRSASCSLTWPPAWMTCASSARWSPTTSTTTAPASR